MPNENRVNMWVTVFQWIISYDFRVYLELKLTTKTKGQEGVNAFKVFKARFYHCL